MEKLYINRYFLKTIYISGPISGYDTEERKRAFKEATRVAGKMGYIPVNPMEYQVDGWTWEAYMRRDIKELMDCDAILMMPGWEQSRGAKLEKDIAERIGMEVLYMKEGGEG